MARLVANWPNNRFLSECNCLGLVKVKSLTSLVFDFLSASDGRSYDL